MLTPGKVIEILRKVLPHLGSSYGVKKMALFGSFAKGVQREDSDIDILVEFEKPIGFKFMDFAEYIEKRVGRKVDILTPEGIKGIRIKQVAEDIRRGVVYV
ncbi:MAG: nucleotidyltransferase family protein [Candidatus Altiarchaeota archaeon]|nr:nucleotidyltransferase family protein [Candidatus Altiarchaeota archaeon]